MKLVDEIIKGLLPEDDEKTVAIYAGGFKPPTRGHFQVVKQALEEHPNIDELLIYIGKKERGGITQAQSLLVWEIYATYLPLKVQLIPTSTPPIKAVYDYSKNNPDTNILWVIGAREGDDEDFKDIADRTKNIDNYPNIALAVTITTNSASGTAARNAANISVEKLKPLLPTELKDEEVVQIYNIITDNINEGRKKKKDPKKGTGKKPKGSGRRLYTDEDPKDTVGIKFSTRQDIVNTLAKKSFKAKSHARQSQIINLIHQRVRAALGRTKDPKKKSKLQSGFKYITKRKEASKKKTQRLKKQKLNEKLCKRGEKYIAKRKREGEKHNPFLSARAVKVCKGQMSGTDGKQKKDFRPSKGKKRSAQGRKPDIVKEIGINLSNYDGQILPGDVLRAPKGFPLGGKKLESSKQLKVIKNSREGVNRYKLSLEDSNGKKYTVRNFEMDGEYKGKKLPKWGLIRKSKKNLNENASYGKDIDFKSKIVQLTKHMLDKGMNILPLPKVEFVNGDSENARDFFGKTAYYSPSTETIVLYTEGRHPKDIVRSFAHEMIHHIQHLENRLGNIGTTDTTQDKHLDRLEQEANLRGTMTFRNWTDSIVNEEYEINAPEAENAEASFIDEDKPKVKDPFGLNAYARELATLREDDVEYKIFSDMDGVLTDFEGRFQKYSNNMLPQDYERKFGLDKFWELVDAEGVAFWVGMPWLEDGKKYWDYIKNYNVELLSSPSRSETSRLGKRLWVRNNIPGTKLTLAYSANKQKYAAPNHILIDDRKSNIDQWISQGGIGILHTSADDTIRQLQKLGL